MCHTELAVGGNTSQLWHLYICLTVFYVFVTFIYGLLATNPESHKKCIIFECNLSYSAIGLLLQKHAVLILHCVFEFPWTRAWSTLSCQASHELRTEMYDDWHVPAPPMTGQPHPLYTFIPPLESSHIDKSAISERKH